METSNGNFTKQLFSSILLPFNLNNLVSILGIIILLLFNCTLCYNYKIIHPCQSNNWWDSTKNKCIPCTECNEEQTIVLRPCLAHQNSICGSIQDLEIGYLFLGKTETNWKDRRKNNDDINEDVTDNNKESLSNLKLEEEELVDWWEMTLIAVIILFLILFLGVAFLSFQHMRQWRQIEKRLDRDVEELSAKLMAKLANVQNVENGNFIIENPISREAGVRPVQVHCVLLDNYFAGKNPMELQNPGNLYTEDTNTAK